MIFTDTWKLIQDRHYRVFCKESIIEFADILVREWIKKEKAQQAFTLPVKNIISPENIEIDS